MDIQPKVIWRQIMSKTKSNRLIFRPNIQEKHHHAKRIFTCNIRNK